MMESTATKENIKYLFKAFKAIYTHKFTSMYPNTEDMHIAMRLWELKLAPFDRPEIDEAIMELSEVSTWVPTLAEFIAILKRNRANKELKAAMIKVESDATNCFVNPEVAKENIKRLYEMIEAARICGHNEA